jgi:hypothetical protein
MLVNHDDWEVGNGLPHSDNVVRMYRHKERPVLLRIDEVNNLDGTFYRVAFQVSGDHDEYAHEKLFESPILDTEEAAEMFCDAIAESPMAYARKFFQLGTVKKC